MKIFNPKGVLFTLYLFFCVSYTYAQNAALPNVILPSPQAREFHKYGEYPVSHQTGIPDISVPLYEVKSGELTLPISIRYHAGGFKPSDKDGILGLYWSLNVGGMISRQIKGLPDDDVIFNGGILRHPPKTMNELASMDRMVVYDYLAEVGKQTKDAEYDMFSYSVGSNSGNFVLNGSNIGGRLKVDVVLSNDLKKERFTCNLNSFDKIQSFDVFDETGVRYRFGQSVVDGSDATEAGGIYLGPNGTTSWLLTDIISPDFTDTISISYNDYIHQPITYPNYVTSLIWNHEFFNYCLLQREFDPSEDVITPSSPNQYYSIRTINEIKFKGGIVKFNYSPDNKLYAIEIRNYLGELVRTIQFTLSRFDLSNPHHFHKLDEVSLNGNSEVYRFEYNMNQLASGELSEDWWGFYNGGTYPGVMTPPMAMPYIGYIVGQSHVNRDANDNMKTYILNKIIYPTGGSTRFEFEINKYLFGGQQKTAGGLRVSIVENRDATGRVYYKRYKYGVNESGVGRVMAEPVWENLVSYSRDYYWGSMSWQVCIPTVINDMMFMDWSTKEIYVVNNYVPLQTNFIAPVYYQEVIEYLGSDLLNEDNTGKIKYKFNPPVFTIQPQFGALDYFEYPSTIQPKMPAAEQLIIPASEYGQLLEKTIYKRGSNGFDSVRREIYTYSADFVSELHNLRVFRYSNHTKNIHSSGEPDWPREVVLSHPDHIYPPFGFTAVTAPYIYDDYIIINKSISLMSKTVEEFKNGESMLIKEDYTYSPHNKLMTMADRKGSNDRLYSQTNTYTKDVNYSTLDNEHKEAIDSMISRNMLSNAWITGKTVFDPNMEQMVQASRTLETSYKIWDATKRMIRPDAVVDKVFGVTTGKVQFLQYDEEGNITEVRKENDMLHSYIWDYKLQYPVAEVKNAALNDIAFTSFEAENNGGWVVGGVSQPATDAPTGRRAYDIANGNITKGDLTPATEYIVAYWKKGSGLSVTGATGSPVAGPTINGWTYYEQTIKNVSSTTLSGTGLIDEVRLFPSNAQMVTFTFIPLIGMTTEADVNGKITYYEYDAYNRLKTVRDMNRNIIKVIDYQFNVSNQQ